jgi:crotonobetainyl-CoA:carnitine CoA-transferase CaiB-like acyl-CoA transferase
MATLLLAEAGAEVVKVERPGRGEEMRGYDPRWGRDSVNFALLNRGKKSLALDLKSPADLERLRPLVERADVVVEQFRPGVMARLGLDYESVARVNPKAIYCSITGYGQTGPKRDVAGHDLNYIGDAGLLALSMGPASSPVVPPALIADIAGGAYPTVMNILLALQERERTGRGRHLDVAMSDNLFPFMYWAIGNGLGAGQWPGNGTDLVTGGTPRYRLYPTQDGGMVAAAPIEQKFWETFCTLIDLDASLRDDARDPAATTARVAEIIAGRTAAAWRELFAGQDCCCSVVADVRTALDDPHFKARGLFGHVLVNEEGRSLPALPVPIDPGFRAAPDARLEAPLLGAHNEELLS